MTWRASVVDGLIATCRAYALRSAADVWIRLPATQAQLIGLVARRRHLVEMLGPNQTRRVASAQCRTLLRAVEYREGIDRGGLKSLLWVFKHLQVSRPRIFRGVDSDASPPIFL